MRIWDLPVGKLCNPHLLGEHAELHAIWNILTKCKKGYSRHPETLRWRGRLKALFNVHEEIAAEMRRRKIDHQSPLDKGLARGKRTQDRFVDSPEEQVRLLRKKKCRCKV